MFLPQRCGRRLASGRAGRRTIPSRPIRLVVPFAPGGNVDVTARVISQKARRVLGQPVVDRQQGWRRREHRCRSSCKVAARWIHAAHGCKRSAVDQSDCDAEPCVRCGRRTLRPVGAGACGPTGCPLAKSKTRLGIRAAIDREGKEPSPTQLPPASAGVGSMNHLAIELFNVIGESDAAPCSVQGRRSRADRSVGGRWRATSCFDQL